MYHSMIFNGSIITTSARLIWNDLDVNNDVMLCSMLGWLDTFRLLLLTWCGWTMAPRTFPHDSEDWGRCQPKYSSPPVMSEGNPEASIGEKKLDTQQKMQKNGQSLANSKNERCIMYHIVKRIWPLLHTLLYLPPWRSFSSILEVLW